MRAQGWAEAEKAKAQRKPAAMREHEQIFGQAPREDYIRSETRTIDLADRFLFGDHPLDGQVGLVSVLGVQVKVF